MWIKADSGNWFDTDKISAVIVRDYFVEASILGDRVPLSEEFETRKSAHAFADRFVAKFLKEDNHVD